MAAYAAVISLKHTIERLQKSSRLSSVISLHDLPIKSALHSARNELDSLQAALQSLNDSSATSRSSDGVSSLDCRIQDAVHELEDALELQISNHFVPHSDHSLGGDGRPLLSTINEATNSFAEMKEECLGKLSNPTLLDTAATDIFGGGKPKLVGVSVEYDKLKNYLIGRGATDSYQVVSIVGMAGVGKTALARTSFEDTTILNNFQCRAWVRVGQTHQPKEIVQSILDQLVAPNKMLRGEGSRLRERLLFKRYLLVLDDVWDCKVWENLTRFLPKHPNGSRVLITTRLVEIPKAFSSAVSWSETKNYQIHQIQMKLLGEKESWRLFCDKVFGEDQLSPPQLEKGGKKIAEKCDGLPLTIVTVAARLLSKADQTAEYWNKVADERESSVFVEAYEQISKVLMTSYNHLSQHLKVYFLYMAVFPQKYEIHISKLIILWIVEGFVESTDLYKFFPVTYLQDLVSNNILLVHQLRHTAHSIKTCSLHSAFWQLCVRIARENKFLHVLYIADDGLGETIKRQRRLCVHNNVLFAIKEVYDSMALISAAHSLLCTGQYHQYPVRLCLGLRLLRVLDALTIRLYEFPVEVVNLIHLRYLTLTYDGKLPASISKLWNLLVLIVHQHLLIRSPTRPSYLPVEIWDMKELIHLKVVGNNLPDPTNRGSLEKLKTLLDVSPLSCTKRVFQNMPRLITLGIQIELGMCDAVELMSCFGSLSCLLTLRSLKCVIVNPVLMSEVVAPPPTILSMLPSYLCKLSLSGFGYGWENMSKIASLPNLEVLKLRCYAFQGPEWRTHKPALRRLKYLLVESTDLVQWRSDSLSFPYLKRITFRHCYNLKHIPQFSQNQFSELEMIEVIGCHPSLVTWAKQEGEKIKERIQRSNIGDNSGNLNSLLKVKEMWSD